jgi:hypothetical protein
MSFVQILMNRKWKTRCNSLYLITKRDYMKKLLSLFVGLIVATAIANCDVPINGTSGKTAVVIDEPASVTTVTSTTPSGISGDGSVVAPSVYNDGVNQYFVEQPTDIDPGKNCWWVDSLPFWYELIKYLIFL